MTRPPYIPHSRSTRRAYAGMIGLASSLGIEVEPRWRQSFGAFVADMQLRPEGTILLRRNNRKGFTADNCAWLPPSERKLVTA